MSAAIALARRELTASLLTPAGGVILAVFVLFTAVLHFVVGAVVGGGFNQGEPASLHLLFAGGIWVFLFVAPAVSMRSMSEEYRLGTIEVLQTSPMADLSIVLGKFAGALGFLLVLLVPTLFYVVLVEVYGRPDWGRIACGYAGWILAGAAFLSTGLLFSSLTASQVLAYLATLFFWLVTVLFCKGLPVALLERRVAGEDVSDVRRWFVGVLADVGRSVGAADPQRIIADFSSGLVDSANVVRLLAITVAALVLTVAVLAQRRWR